MAKEYYELHVAGCTRQLPILNVTDSLAIAGFVILGDTELTVNTAKELAAKLPAEAFRSRSGYDYDGRNKGDSPGSRNGPDSRHASLYCSAQEH